MCCGAEDLMEDSLVSTAGPNLADWAHSPWKETGNMSLYWLVTNCISVFFGAAQ